MTHPHTGKGGGTYETTPPILRPSPFFVGLKKGGKMSEKLKEIEKKFNRKNMIILGTFLLIIAFLA